MRIEPNRPGYNGYTCAGLPYPTVPPPLDCTNNQYAKLPAQAEGAVSDNVYENLSPIDNNERYIILNNSCDLFFDPFKGTFIDLYQAYLDEDLEDFIEDDCYANPEDKYEPGYSPPKPVSRDVQCTLPSMSSNSEPPSSSSVYPCEDNPAHPTVYLTVSGSTAKLVKWCGEDWTLPFESGKRKEVCPTEYIREIQQILLASDVMKKNNIERWRIRNDTGAYSELLLQANQAKFSKDGQPYDREQASHWIFLKLSDGIIRRDRAIFKQFLTGGTDHFQACQLGLYCYLPEIDFFDYRIRNEQFGSYTDSDNITYKWERGMGWI